VGAGSFFFAGGGTGGHIYPAIAVARKILQLQPAARIHFFCSNRSIDAHILAETDFEYTVLPARSPSVSPARFASFCKAFLRSHRIAKGITAARDNPVVVGVGGFVAAPACYSAHKLKVPLVLLNIDIVPGLAGKLIARWADEIFLQFPDTQSHFAGSKAQISVVGCPLRDGFEHPQPHKAMEQLSLDENKKVLLITGASSGSQNINEAVGLLLQRLDAFADGWQIVHLTGRANYEKVAAMYARVKIGHKVLDYFDDMPDLLAAADLVVGRSGAVSVAEYAAARVPAVCMPYPYHKDRHQYLNAGKLVEAGAAVIVDDLPDASERAEWLWEELRDLMRDDAKRQEMAHACRKIANVGASAAIAQRLVQIAS
jgi:UDP-N-acetylglucosamine--N-acetylmuramyl-(pentapeptide) pyrophosphoryl-undecaprenol N-acetylglucosamine transferase